MKPGNLRAVRCQFLRETRDEALITIKKRLNLSVGAFIFYIMPYNNDDWLKGLPFGR